MSIRQISLNNFRNLKSTTIDLHPKLNILYGSNASGKTSFLEALYILCQGQTFKSSNLSQCILHKASSFLLFSHFKNYKVGISRTFNKTTIRINAESINRVSTLAEKSPVRIINASSLNLIIGSPADKREFLDWCLFHVEHRYHQLWTDYNHALKQRNALLKQKKNLQQLDYWDNHLSLLNYEIYNLRLDFCESFKQCLFFNFNDVLNELEIDISYRPGWDQKQLFKDVLSLNRDKDIRYGFTRFGIHRDDLVITAQDFLVQQVLSRGQIKKLSVFMILSQIIFISQFSNKKVILLIDDLESELDVNTVESILKKISEHTLQVFISLIKPSFELFSHNQDYKMFHVEHGIIRPVKNS